MRSRPALTIGKDIARQRADFRFKITGWSDEDLMRASLNYAVERDGNPQAYRFYTVRIRAILNEMVERWKN